MVAEIKHNERRTMKNPVSVTVPMTAGRTVTFTTTATGVQVIATGAVSPREISEVRPQALQRLADETSSIVRDGIETYQPNFIPGEHRHPYRTRLLRRPSGEVNHP
jgi:hypothetical protein